MPRFDLNFPGGTPEKLVEAIQTEIEVLNAIIPNEVKDEKLPPLKMRNVNVKQLFEALEMASERTVEVQQGGGRISHARMTMAFRAAAPVTPETVWYFYAQKPPQGVKTKMARYYQLNPYLAKYKIDDITTAIQEGWKMLGDPETPELSYHQDTKLLIAVGESNDLIVIDSVLQELSKGIEKTGASSGRPDPAPVATGPEAKRPL